MRMSSLVKVVALTVVLGYPSLSGAQVAPADAQAFMGSWAIDVNTPAGPISVDLTVTEANGAVAAEVGGGTTGGPMAAVSEITKNGSSLVMKYEADVQGAVTPITLTAEVGFDEYFKRDEWTPVRVTVANNGPDIEGAIIIDQGNSTPTASVKFAVGVGFTSV